MRPEPGSVRRRKTYQAGQRAETLALLWMALKGYRVLARRYTVKGGEIDLILRRGDIIVFAEVKARPTLDVAMTAVTATKQQRVGRAAAVWLSRNPWAQAMTLRGDIIAVAPWRMPCHLPDAIPLRPGW